MFGSCFSAGGTILEGCRIFRRWTLGEGNGSLSMGLVAFLLNLSFFLSSGFFLSTVWLLCLPHHSESCPLEL